MRPRHLKLWISIISIGVIFNLILGLVLFALPSAGKVIGANSNPIVAILTFPENETSWPADTSIPIAVTAYGENPITTVELWIDGKLFNSSVPFGNEISAYKSWYWMPGVEGKHTLFVRAIDNAGLQADTNAVHITATPAAGLLDVLVAKGDETLADLAEGSGNSLAVLVELNSEINPEEPIPAGTEVFVPSKFEPIPPDEEEPTSPSEGIVDTGKNSYSTGFPLAFQGLLNPDAEPPAAPGLTSFVNECTAHLTILDNSTDEEGFFVYQLMEKDVTFVRVGTLKSHDGIGNFEYQIFDVSGQNQFYVSSFNSAGEASSSPTGVEITSADCHPVTSDNGKISYENGLLSMPAGMDLAYFYFSINGGDWQRIPSGHKYFNPLDGKVDIRDEIKKSAGEQAVGIATLDVWAWKGNDLEYLGQIGIDVGYSKLKMCSIGTAPFCGTDTTKTYWTTNALIAADKQEVIYGLRWYAIGSDISSGVWQVSTEPFPEPYTPYAFPGLLLTGVSTPVVNSEGVATGDFEINFSTDLLLPSTESTNTDGNLLLADSFNTNLFTQFTGSQAPGPNAYNALLTRTLYIRVTPMAGGHPATDSSNTIVVTLQPTDTQQAKFYDIPTFQVEIVPDSFTPEIVGENTLGIRGCSIITAVDHDVFYQSNNVGSAKALDEYYNYWKSRLGQKVCPAIIELDDPSWIQEIWTAISSAWSSLVDAFESLKAGIVDAMASLIPGCDAMCKLLLTTGLNFAISYFTGIPPSIPSFDDLVDKGIEYAVEQAVAQTGVPYCDSICRDAIAGVIKDAADGLKVQKPTISCAAQKYTMLVFDNGVAYHLQPLCLPAGVTGVPVPHSATENATILIKVTRLDTFNQPIPNELLVIDSFAVNYSYATGLTESMLPDTASIFDHKETPYTMTYSEILQGGVYPQMTYDIPGIDSTRSIEVPVIFNQGPGDFKMTGYPPRIAGLQAAYPGEDVTSWVEAWFPDYRHLNDPGAEITITAYVLCLDQEDPTYYSSPCSNKVTETFTVTQQVAPPIAVPTEP